jgi:hypothetical protein
METPEPTTNGNSGTRAFDQGLPEYVDWLVATLIALGGLGLAVGGSALTFVVDRSLLAEGIEGGQIALPPFEQELTRAETVDFTLAVASWAGIGLLVTGLGLVLFAVGFVVVRHRASRRGPPDEPTGTTRSYAVLGAVVAALLSFVPFSPLAGGGLAGYLGYHGNGRAVSTGALSGFLSVAPILSVLAFLTVGIYTGLADVQQASLGVVSAVAMCLVVLVISVYGTGLGALGGFIGGRFADS